MSDMSIRQVNEEMTEAYNSDVDGFEFVSGGKIGSTVRFDPRLTMRGVLWRPRSRKPPRSPGAGGA